MFLEAPGSAGVPDSGWADGAVLIVTPRTALPPVCVKCGRPTLEPPLPRQISWRPVWVYFLLLLGILPFVIAAAVTSRNMKVAFPLCTAHKEYHRILKITGVILTLAAIPEMFIAMSYLPESSRLTGFLAGVAAFFAGLVCVALANTILGPKFIDHHYAYLRRANRGLLSLLPPLPPDVPRR